METFPESFNLETIRTAIENHETEYGRKQMELLAKERGRIFSAFQQMVNNGGYELLIELPDELCADMKLKLSKELLERFPNHIYYRKVIEYADVDEFVLMTTPRASFDYKIKLR